MSFYTQFYYELVKRGLNMTYDEFDLLYAELWNKNHGDD